ncbi:MAG: 2OG-Fe(II) oxygenase [Rhodospirillales bacterium]
MSAPPSQPPPQARDWLQSPDLQRQGPPAFILAYPNVLPADECRALIERFEADERVRPSWGKYSERPTNRTGAMLATAQHPDWRDVVERINGAIRPYLEHYAGVFTAFKRILITDQWELSAPLIERIEPGQGFDWHFDGNLPGTERRVLATILYLADIADGGATQFAYQGAAVQPKAGMLVLFPPFWTHLHRGDTPKAGRKYNVTNFVVLRS